MTRTVLAIDDSPSLRNMIRATLGAEGYEVVLAADGAEGLRMAQGRRLNAVLTDLNMPVMGGMEFIRRFRAGAEHKGVPVVVLTTETDEALKREARAAGATGWLAKPFDQAKLIGVMRKVLGA